MRKVYLKPDAAFCVFAEKNVLNDGSGIFSDGLDVMMNDFFTDEWFVKYYNKNN